MFPSPIFLRISEPVYLDSWIKSWTQDHAEMGLDLASLVDLGCVYLNHKRIAPLKAADVQLKADDIIRIHPKPRRYTKSFAHFRDLVIDETDEFVIFDKPSGAPVHPTLDNLHENLLTWGSADLGYPLFITHRLDVGTSGMMIYAKTAEAQSKFNRWLQEGLVQKIYRARGKRVGADAKFHVPNPLPLAPWIHWMKPSYRAPKEVSRVEFDGGIRCESRPRQIDVLGDIAEVELELVTGRTHQIRAQMSDLGWPIVGDHMYGSKEHPDWVDRWDLRCIELTIPG